MSYTYPGRPSRCRLRARIAYHNWHHGVRRLLLGYAIDAYRDALFDDVTPRALDRRGFRSGTADYERLGRFHRYCETTFALDAAVRASRRCG